MNPYRSKAFLQLRDEWYRRLQEEGFLDIETTKRSDPTSILKQYHSLYFNSRYSPEEMAETTKYYDSARAMSLKGESFINAKVWRLYSDGIEQREIARMVKKSPARVCQIISKYKKRLICE